MNQPKVIFTLAAIESNAIHSDKNVKTLTISIEILRCCDKILDFKAKL